MAASPDTDPALLTIRAERAADLRAAVARLQEPYREVVGLRFFGELSLEEIARETQRPLATVKTHLRRGLLLLRGAVEPGSDS
jgi:RNA polymerase sigma-70 factor (ECF subfamily)